MQETNFTVDLLIKFDDRDCMEKDFKKRAWPFKGIVVEYDGPHHFMLRRDKNIAQFTPFTVSRHQLIEKMGYKLYVVPFNTTGGVHLM